MSTFLKMDKSVSNNYQFLSKNKTKKKLKFKDFKKSNKNQKSVVFSLIFLPKTKKINKLIIIIYKIKKKKFFTTKKFGIT